MGASDGHGGPRPVHGEADAGSADAGRAREPASDERPGHPPASDVATARHGLRLFTCRQRRHASVGNTPDTMSSPRPWGWGAVTRSAFGDTALSILLAIAAPLVVVTAMTAVLWIVGAVVWLVRGV